MNPLRSCLTAALILLAAGPARGDAVPHGKKLIPVVTVVEVAAGLPDYCFFETEWGFNGEPPPVTPVTLTPDVPFRWTGQGHHRRSAYALCGVPRSMLDQGRVPDQLANQLASPTYSGQIVGALRLALENWQQVPATDPRDTITIHHQIERNATGDGLQVITTGNELPRSWSLAWLFAPAAVVVAGFWLIRRRRRKVHAS